MNPAMVFLISEFLSKEKAKTLSRCSSNKVGSAFINTSLTLQMLVTLSDSFVEMDASFNQPTI